ncbi:complement factor B-like [Lampetra fluviatilis]
MGERRAALKHVFCTNVIFLLNLHLGVAAQLCNLDVKIKGGDVILPGNPIPGSILHYVCPDGAYPYPVAWRVCQRDGSWTPLLSDSREHSRLASCNPMTCVQPLEFENGEFYPRKSVYKVGDKIQFSCYSGFRVYGSSFLSCQPNGKWNGSLPICDDDAAFCHNPGIPFGSRKSGKDYNLEGVVTYTCPANLIPSGTFKRVCLSNHQWSGKEPSCESRYSFDTAEDIEEALNNTMLSLLHRQGNTEEKLNVYLLIDASQSVGKDNFQLGVGFLMNLILKMSNYAIQAKYAIVVFASQAKTKLALTEKTNQDPKAVINILKELSYSEFEESPGTNTGEALLQVVALINSYKQQQQRLPIPWNQNKHISFIVTDGRSNMGPPPKIVMNEKFADIPMDIYTFGIGNVYKEELVSIASQKKGERHSFMLLNYRELQKIGIVNTDKTLYYKCGIATYHELFRLSRIFNGKATNITEWPWHVRIQIGEHHSCGGTIISPHWIMTAAHCFSMIPPDGDISRRVSVFIGSHLPSGGEHRSVKRVLIHDKYNERAMQRELPGSEFYDYDIAILELHHHLTFGDTKQPVCLPCTKDSAEILKLEGTVWKDWEEFCHKHTAQQILTENGEGIITGFGMVNATAIPTQLQQATIQLKDNSACLEEFVKFHRPFSADTLKTFITKNMLCAGGTGADACKGDSGGPFIVKRSERWIQIGVVSWGVTPICGGGQRNGLYTNVVQMMQWIKSHVYDIDFRANGQVL